MGNKLNSILPYSLSMGFSIMLEEREETMATWLSKFESPRHVISGE